MARGAGGSGRRAVTRAVTTRGGNERLGAKLPKIGYWPCCDAGRRISRAFGGLLRRVDLIMQPHDPPYRATAMCG